MWLLWIPLFVIATGLVGLSTLRMMRRRLERAHLETRLPTALVGILVLVILPLGAGALGGHFAWNRALAHGIVHGGDVALSEGAASLKAALGDAQKKLSPEDVRSLVRMYAAERPLKERLFY